MALIFHIDSNSAKYRPEYLKSFLPVLREYGFDKILWEIEDSVRFDTAPGAAAPDALTKAEFRKILDFAISLGFDNIPLLQTVSHNAYVLRQERFYPLSEHPGFLELYCLSSPDVRSFLLRWIDEYLELFPEARFFHLGADEAWAIGRFCERCRKAISEKDEGSLMADHLRPLTERLLGRGVVPVIWADMAIRHPSLAQSLDRRVIMADWNYGSADDCGKTAEKDAFNAAHDFRKQGFRVWGCGAGRSYGDSVFAPRYDLHRENLERWLALESAGVTEATLFTSWSVHLFPFSLQEPIFARGIKREVPLDQFETEFALRRFGMQDSRFFEAVRLVSYPAPLSRVVDLGYSQVNQKACPDALETSLQKNPVDREQVIRRRRNYEEALALFRRIPGTEEWQFAARHLIFRSKLAILLSGGETSGLRKELETDLPELEALTRKEYGKRLLPFSAGLAADNLFLPVKEILGKHS